MYIQKYAIYLGDEFNDLKSILFDIFSTIFHIDKDYPSYNNQQLTSAINHCFYILFTTNNISYMSYSQFTLYLLNQINEYTTMVNKYYGLLRSPAQNREGLNYEIPAEYKPHLINTVTKIVLKIRDEVYTIDKLNVNNNVNAFYDIDTLTDQLVIVNQFTDIQR